MKKYLTVFKISFQQEFVYRLNFVMWRFRNIMQIFLIFFLWDTVFSDPKRVVFGYDRSKILTYVFAVLVMKSLVLSSRAIDIAGEISQGTLSNYLLKPISYFKYWFTRDMSSKTLNLGFAVIEVSLLYLVLRPPFFLQKDIIIIVLFLISLVISVILFFQILVLFNLFPLWYPEQAWGATFLLLIFVEFLGGGIFPIDILPNTFQKILYLTPFPYLLFMPIQIYLGRTDILISTKGVFIAGFWALVLSYLLKLAWNFGLKIYRSEGR